MHAARGDGERETGARIFLAVGSGRGEGTGEEGPGGAEPEPGGLGLVLVVVGVVFLDGGHAFFDVGVGGCCCCCACEGVVGCVGSTRVC